MRDLCFFIQNNMVEKLTIPVAQFCNQHDIPMHDRSSTADLNIDDCGMDWTVYKRVIPFGSVQFLRKCKESCSIGRYIEATVQNYSAAHWNWQIKDWMLNSDGQYIMACDVASLLRSQITVKQFHVRPLEDHKAFTAQVFDKDSWQSMWHERKMRNKWNIGCWISPVKEILREWRLWVIHGRVIECSRYRSNNEHSRVREMPPDVVGFVQCLPWLPEHCTVVDVALTAENKLKVVEFNQMNTSGWYAADTDLVLYEWLKYHRSLIDE